jgi:hypothetical protein
MDNMRGQRGEVVGGGGGEDAEVKGEVEVGERAGPNNSVGGARGR